MRNEIRSLQRLQDNVIIVKVIIMQTRSFSTFSIDVLVNQNESRLKYNWTRFISCVMFLHKLRENS